MTAFKKFAPVAALAFALSPFAAGAVTTQAPTHNAGYISGTAISQFAANSAANSVPNFKGRPGDYQAAANSKGRPGAFADNSKGRPSENPQSAPETPFG